MTRVMLATSEERSEIGHLIEIWGHVYLGAVHERAHLQHIGASGAELLLVDAVSDLLDEQLVRDAIDAGVRVVALAAHPTQYARAASLGVDVLNLDSMNEQLPDVLNGAALLPPPVRNGNASGEIIAVWGAPGGAGASTIAVNLAAEFVAGTAKRNALRFRRTPVAAKGRVCLVDLDCWSPALTAMLGTVSEIPGVAAAARLAGHDAFTEQEFMRLAMPMANGGLLLSGLTALDRWPELTADRVQAMLVAMREWCDVIVVDLGSRIETDVAGAADPLAPQRDAAVRATLAIADRVIGVGSADPVGLARLVRSWPDWKSASRADPELVVNRVRSRVLGVQPERQLRQLGEQFIGIAPIGCLSEDAKAVDSALVHGTPLAKCAPHSQLRKGVAALAAHLR